MKFDWKKKLAKGTSVKLITRKNRRFTAVKGTVVSHDKGELVVRDKAGKVYKRKEPQKVFMEMKSLSELIRDINV